jgi:hypothetical protein
VAAFALAGCTVRFNNPASAGSSNSQDGSSQSTGGGTQGAPTLVQGTVNVSPVYPSNGANWMDYVVNAGGGGQAWNRPDSPCQGTEAGYFMCLHGGELRQFQATGQSSCSGLTARDALGAFNWICSSSTSPVTFYSRGLAPGKGLRDLINASGTGFLSNSVTVYDSQSRPVFVTPTSVWWSNTFASIPTGANPQPLNSHTIYVVPSSTTTNGLYASQEDKVALVTLGTSVLSYGGTTNNWCRANGGSDPTGTAPDCINAFVVCIGGSNAGSPSRFDWLEASVDASGSSGGGGGVEIAGYSQMIRVHRSHVKGYGWGNGFSQDGSANGTGNAILYSYSSSNGGFCSGCGNTGFQIGNSSTHVTIMNSIGADGAGSNGTGFGSSAANTLFYQDLAYNNGGAAYSTSSGPNFYVASTAFGNGGVAVGPADNDDLLAFSALNNLGADAGNGNGTIEVFRIPSTLANLVIAGTPSQPGLAINNFGPVSVTDIVAANNGGDGIYVAPGASSGIPFDGGIWVGSNGTNCSDASGNSNITSANCARGAASPNTITADATSSYVGIVTSDSVNTTAGLTFPLPYAGAGMAIDWAFFQNAYRGWGLDGSASLFNSANAGACQSGSCQLYDFTLQAGDALLRNAYGAWPGGGTCPASVDPATASNVLSDNNGNTYLKSAIELLDPVLNPGGNYDGLCESGEVCIYTPNLGSYQGTGDPALSTPCTTGTGNGINSPIVLYAFPSS